MSGIVCTRKEISSIGADEHFRGHVFIRPVVRPADKVETVRLVGRSDRDITEVIRLRANGDGAKNLPSEKSEPNANPGRRIDTAKLH